MPRLTERVDVVAAVAPQDIGTADVTGGYIAVSNYREILATLITGVLTDTKLATVELLQAKDSSGTDAKAFVTAVTAVADGAVAVIAEVGGSMEYMDTNNGFTHVAVKLTCDEAGKLGAATLALGNKRYSS